MLLRPVAPHDLDALYQIALESGPGFTSLMPDRDALARKIEHCVASFHRPVVRPSDEHYLFVLEEPDSGEIMGTTGIEAAAGRHQPLVHFHRQPAPAPNSLRRIGRPEETLTLSQHYRGCTEICSLYLRPGFRKANAGKLLSRVRFLFMALHPERFSNRVIAEMRGVSDAAGHSPFWDWLKDRVADLDFADAIRLAAAGEPDLMSALQGCGALQTAEMSDAARAVLGEVHMDTRPARAMLEREGFEHRGYVDLFDGGPTLECARDRIASVRNTRRGRVRVAPGPGLGSRRHLGNDTCAIVANGQLADFRATLTDHWQAAPGQLVLNPDIAHRLHLGNNSPACFLPLANRPWPALAPTLLAQEEVRYAH